MAGTLFLVVGPSGAGKDTLLHGASKALAGDNRYVFPRRTITRPADAGGEEHDAVDVVGLEAAKRQGAFALSWRAHDQAYGIPVAINDLLAQDRHVVINVSRTVLDEARDRFDRVGIIRIDVPREALASRLAQRGREDQAAITGRLERAHAHRVSGDDVTVLVNDGTVEDAVQRLVSLLRDAEW